MRRLILLPGLVFLLLGVLQCNRSATTAIVGVTTLFVGHSQVNHQMPGYFAWIVESAERTETVGRQVIGGGNLEEGYVLHAQTSDDRDSTIDPDSRYLYFDGRISNKGNDSLGEIRSGTVQRLILTEEHGLMQAQSRNSDFQSTHSFSFPSAEYVSTSGDSFLLTTYQRTYGIASGLGFYHEAVSNLSTANVYIYENWFPIVNGQTHCTRLESASATKTLAELNSWRKRIAAYADAWAGVVTEINSERGQSVSGFSYGSTTISDTTIANGEAVTLIPVGQAMSVLSERICAGQVEGISNPNELFLDHAHASQLGDFFVALVMYSALYGESPASITLQGEGTARALDGSDLLKPDSALAAALAEVAHGVVSGTYTANSTDISSCTGITNVSLTEEQLCVDSGDDETIPTY